MLDLSNCEKGDILICKHGVIKEYIKPNDSGIKNDYEYLIKIIYTPFDSVESIEFRNIYSGFVELNGSVCNDGYVFRHKRLETDYDVIKVIKREVFKRYLRMLSNKL